MRDEFRPAKRQKIEIYNDNFQNYKKYGIPKAQLVIADIPYNLGTNFYASNPMWYEGGTTATAKANLQRKRLSTPISISISPNIFISATNC